MGFWGNRYSERNIVQKVVEGKEIPAQCVDPTSFSPVNLLPPKNYYVNCGRIYYNVYTSYSNATHPTFLKRFKRRPAVCLSEHDRRPFLREPPLSLCHAAHESAARGNGRQHNRRNRSNGSRYQHLCRMWCRQQKLVSLRSLQKCTLLQQRMPTRALANSSVQLLTNLGKDSMQCCTLCHWYVVGHAQVVLITVRFV